MCEPSRTTEQYFNCPPVTVFCYTSMNCYAMDSRLNPVNCNYRSSSGYVQQLACATGNMCSSFTVIGTIGACIDIGSSFQNATGPFGCALREERSCDGR